LNSTLALISGLGLGLGLETSGLGLGLETPGLVNIHENNTGLRVDIWRFSHFSISLRGPAFGAGPRMCIYLSITDERALQWIVATSVDSDEY